MKLKEIYKQRLYSAVFPEDLIKKWDPLLTSSLLEDIKGLTEYDRLYVIWSNAQYLHDYFTAQKKYLDGDHYHGIPVDKAGDMTQDYLDPFFDKLDEDNLDEVFKTLEKQPTDPEDNRFKHKIKETASEKNWLRIYAIKLETNVYIITGGAIKLWGAMPEHTITRIELQKIIMVKDYLSENGIADIDSLEDYVLEIEI